MRRFFLPAVLLSLLINPGCSEPPQDAPKAELHSFSRIVKFNGKPANGAVVSLHPIGESVLGVVTPNGVADDNGMFLLTTYKNGDGAPEGKYRVTVSWADLKGGSSSDPEYGPEKLPTRYQSTESSGLELEVKPGLSESPVLDLKTR